MPLNETYFGNAHAAGADDDAGRGGRRVVDRLQSRGEPAAGAIVDARARDVDACRARRRPRPPGPAAAGRKRADGADGRRARRGDRRGVRPRVCQRDQPASACRTGRASHSICRSSAIITALCMATGIAFGVLPALQQSRTSLTEVLNQGGRSGMASPRAQRLTTILLVGELAVTVILLSAAARPRAERERRLRRRCSARLANLWEFRLALPQPQVSGRRSAAHVLRCARGAARRGAGPAIGGAGERRRRSTPATAAASSWTASPFRQSSRSPQTQVVAIGPTLLRDAWACGWSAAAGFEDAGCRVARDRRAGQRTLCRSASRPMPIRSAARSLLDQRAHARTRRRSAFTIVGIAPPLRQQHAERAHAGRCTCRFDVAAGRDRRR